MIEPDELDAALHLAAELREPFGQDALGLVLGDAEHEGERAVETIEPEGRDLGVAREKVDATSSERDFMTVARSQASGCGWRSIR